ncbi:MAG: uroporphyrinogen decarboxylase family protein [Eubacteriaceae bacterium]
MSVDMKLVEEKKERVIKTIRREEVDKPPFMFIADGYYPYYAGVDKSEITTYEKAAEISLKVTEDLQYDTTLMPYMPANLLYAPNIQSLGGGCHVVKDCSRQICPEKVVIMSPEEYPALIKDPAKFLLETALPRRLELLGNKSHDEKYNGFLQVLQEGKKVGQYARSLEAGGMLSIRGGSPIFSPVDYIFDFLRDFSGIMGDVKRHPEFLRDAGLAILENLKPVIKSMPTASDRGIFIPMHIPAFLRPKDFEKVYWPSFKGLVEYMVEQGHNVVCYFEKKYGHLFDYLQELPKQGVIGIFQEDDIRITKEILGKTMTIAGGLSTTIMQHGTKQECIDHVKGLIDDLCPGGGYFIAPDTPMMFPVDAKPENLKAIADYIRDYRL